MLDRAVIVGAAEKESIRGPPAYGFAILDAGANKVEITSIVTQLEASAEKGSIVEKTIGSSIMHGLKDEHMYRHTGVGWEIILVGMSLLMYANDYSGKFPESLTSNNMMQYIADVKVLESPRKPKSFNGPSYIYIAGQNTHMNPANVIVYENPQFCRDDINVLFLDSHVQAMGKEEFLKALEATYKQLGRAIPKIKFNQSGSCRPPEK